MKLPSHSTKKTSLKLTSNMIKRGKKHIIAKPKKIYNKMPWRSPAHNQRESGNGTNNMASTGAAGPVEASKRSLLAGKLSDGAEKAQHHHVPKGSVAVYVGPQLKRFVVPMTCLSMPDFRVLMDRTAEEFGFESEGALELPCDEEQFQRVLSRCLSKDKKKHRIMI